VPNKVGQLAAVTELLGSSNLNITAVRAAETGSHAEFVLGTKNTQKALKALAPLGVEVKETDGLYLEMPNKAGRLQKAAKKLADAGVNIHSLWGTAFSGKTAGCILTTSDDAKARAALKKK
jgi:hypothetical protein